MTRTTDFVLRHRLLVTLFWVLLAAAGAATASTTTSRLATTFTAPGSPAYETSVRVANTYHVGASQDPDVITVAVPNGQTVDSPAVTSELARVFAAARQVGGVQIVDYTTTHDRAFLTSDGRGTFALAYLPEGNPDTGSKLAPALESAVRAAAPPGWQVGVTGLNPLAQAGSGRSGNGVLAETLIGGLGALAVLAFVFASFLALLPVLMAAISILTTFLFMLGLTHVTDISFIAQFVVALVGLGVAIDYVLLVTTRWREERSHGMDNREAVRRAMAHAGRAVVFSGLTVAIGLLTLVFLPIPALRSVGFAGALIPLASVAVAVTLLPVLLDTVGPRLDWPRIRTERTASRGWTAWARLTVRRRWPAAILGLAALLALAAPVAGIHLGAPHSDSLATQGPARDALNTLTNGGVRSGVLTPMTVLAKESAAGDVARRLAEVPGVVTATATGQAREGTALVTVLPRDEAGSAAGQDTVARVRDAAAGDVNVLGVTGSGPVNLDFRSALYGTFPWMLLILSLVTFLLLARAFRSLLLPAKAVLLNLVSLGAAFGVMVLVWQQGHGSESLWGVVGTGALSTWIPLMVFAFLYGLSMDYEVFLLARMREAYDAGHTTDDAVVEGLSRTGRLVTSAALILLLSFVAMSTAPVVDVKVLATGLGAGIFVDATIVRCLLVPTLVSLLGKWNWWLPARAAAVLRVAPSPVSA
jgi:RND superfamily putative drug exporter